MEFFFARYVDSETVIVMNVNVVHFLEMIKMKLYRTQQPDKTIRWRYI